MTQETPKTTNSYKNKKQVTDSQHKIEEINVPTPKGGHRKKKKSGQKKTKTIQRKTKTPCLVSRMQYDII